ncbi:MAG: hypothetical protein LBI86_09655 [Treponema sp.]|jgi:hypothetical protein|nr:hypothetical protein [Treponema sp.]
MPELLNLDALRAPSRKVRFLGRDYELGYIPAGAAIPIYDAYTRLLEKQTREAGGQDVAAHLRYAETHAGDVVEDTIGFVARFCSFFYPEVTCEEVARDASKDMVDAFFVEIIGAIVRNSAAGKASGEERRDTKKNGTGPDLSTGSA